MAMVKAKKKRVSKKLKISWRKHVDIQDVEEFLEDQRLEERLGPPLSTVANDELFKVDSKPSLELLLSAGERRKLKANKPLKCFSALQPSTKVPDPITKRNRVRTKEERKNLLIKQKEQENLKKGVLKHKDIQANANRKLDEFRRNSKPKRGEFSTDLWSSCNSFPIEKDEWATSNTKKHNLRGIGVPVKNVRKSVMEKKSPLPAVEPPHPGMSYNPSFKDHQDLLRIVADKELTLMKEEEHLTRCTKGMFQKVTPESRNQTWLVEMSEGLPSKGGDSEENDASDNEYTTVNPPVKNLKKSLKQRRKQKEQLELEKQRRKLKLEKKKVTDIHKLNILNKKIETVEKKQKLLREKRKVKAEEKKKGTKKLGSIKFEEPEVDFNMGQEIAGNLKNLKTEGNLLVDRFKSMQKRNILVPTKKHSRKKTKVKTYVKPGHKEGDWKKTVAH